MKFLELLVNAVNTILQPFVHIVCTILPQSPFARFMDFMEMESQYVLYVQYFLPVAEILAIFDAWLACIITWYVYKFFNRVVLMLSNTGIVPL